MRSLLVSIVGLAFALGACTDDAQLGTAVQESHSWNGYHWARTANPFTLDVGDNLSSAWQSYLTTTISDWSKSTVLDLAKVAGGATSRKCRGTSGRVEVCNNTYGNNGWLGIASVSVNGLHITSGTVKLNDTYFNTAQYNTSAWRNLVSCQEVGHTLGLDHQDTNFTNPNLGTCMDYTNDPSTNQHPDQHDYDELQTIYSHLDSTTTLGATTVTSNHADESHGDWGHLESSTHGGHAETYVLELGNDQRMVTFVLWAD